MIFLGVAYETKRLWDEFSVEWLAWGVLNFQGRYSVGVEVMIGYFTEDIRGCT